MSDSDHSAHSIRPMRTEDGANVWRLIQRAGTLDLNSAYLYLLLGRFYGDTCLVATGEDDEQLAGFVTAFIPPGREDTVFLWQIGVDPDFQGQGVAGRMLRALLNLPACRQAHYLETTVTPDNDNSRGLFHAYARRAGTELREHDFFPAELFPEPDHEAEKLLRIGPIDKRPE